MQTQNLLEDFILKNYKNLSFLELIRYLKLSENKKNFDEVFEFINIRPNLSLSFPNSDISSISKNYEDKYLINVNFLGLFGVSSPLPNFYTEDLIDEHLEDNDLTIDFYCIFNKYKYQQYFNSFFKYRLSNRFVENNENNILKIFFSFIGENFIHGFDKLNYIKKYELLRFSNILLNKNRSKDGLIKLIQGFFDLRKIEIIEFINSYENIKVEQQFSLGIQNSTLYEDAHIGSKISIFDNTIKIVLHDLSKNDFNYFQKSNEGYFRLEELINFYLNNSFKWIIEYRIDNKYKLTTLNEHFNSSLGINTWLNSQKETHDNK